MSQKKEKKQAVARNEMTKAQWTWHEIKRNKAAYLMVAPFMIIFTCFTILPVVLSAVLSLTNFNHFTAHFCSFWSIFASFSYLPLSKW